MNAPDPDVPRWWQWPTILSLDAPAIVLLWQAIVADAAGVSPGWPERFVLGASVWLAYTIDRWIEAWRLDRSAVRTPRHLFHQRWRWPAAIAAAGVLAADLAIAFTRLDPGDIVVGVIVMAAVLAYLLSHQWRHRHARWRLPKEFCVALLLAAGVWLFVRDGSGPALWTSLVLFGLLCLANTALISRWETDVDRRHGQTSLALQSPRVARLIVWLPWLAVVTSAAVVVVGAPSTDLAGGCAMVSALLLAAIDRIEPRTGWPLARVMSDLALMTPIVALVMG